MAAVATSAGAQTSGSGWLNNDTMQTRYGTFGFKNGYPAGDTTDRLLETQKLNRAVEVSIAARELDNLERSEPLLDQTATAKDFDQPQQQ